MNLLNQNNELLLPSQIQDGLHCLGSCEIFLTSNDLDKIQMLKLYKFGEQITVNVFEDYLRINHYPFDLDLYIKDNILIEFQC